MDADDDMIVVIVGDGENEEFPAAVKEEITDDDEVEKLIETAAIHGEGVNFFVQENKFSTEGDPRDWEQYLDDDDDEYVPEDDDDDDEDDYYCIVDGSPNEDTNCKRYRMHRRSQQKSFVKELKEKYPELKNNSKILISTLSEIMRNVKPPPPPRDYFIMNGIMFECVFCGKISETQPAAGRHYQEKHGERYLICFACGVDFRSTTNLYKHEKRCLSADSIVVLKARARVLGRKGRSRPFIPKTFPKDAKKASSHKFECSQCPAAFVSKTYLRSHELLHRGLRPYKCGDCACAYTSLAALTRHRKKHSDVQYICDNCGRMFKVKAALVTHMDTHLPLKKFVCTRCEKRYATKAALLRHVESQHLLLPPPCVCKICHKRYPLMSVLKEHTRKAHGLLLMTRRMFFKSLPTLTDTQIEQAKVVLKSEMEPDGSLLPLDFNAPNKIHDQMIDEKPDKIPDKSSNVTPFKVLHGMPVKMPDEKPVLMPVKMFHEVPIEIPIEIPDGTPESNDLSGESPDQINGSNLMGAICKIELEDNGSEEQSIVLSEEILQYMQSVQGGNGGQGYNVMIIENGEVFNLNCSNVPQELLTNGQLVLENGEYVVQSEM